MDETPMMKQYLGFKKQYPDKIVLFRMGDFFETFGEDAKITARVLNITLTRRDKKSNPTPLAGFPHKAIDQYLPKLIESGYCVVVVDQLEDPKFAKGIVKRGVTRVVTPGTLDGDWSNSIKDTYIAAFSFDKKNIYAALCDLSTGKFLMIGGGDVKSFVRSILSAYDPVEILLLDGESNSEFGSLPVQFVEKGLKNISFSKEIVKSFFDVQSLESLGIKDMSSEVIPVSMILKYIEDTQLMNPKHIQKPRRVNIGNTMVLDPSTIRNLELVSNSQTGDISNSLFGILNQTKTRMGTRLLYSWILNPLLDAKDIEARKNIVAKFISNPELMADLRYKLEEVNDIERIAGKIGLNRANARDFKALELSFNNIAEIFKSIRKEFKIEYKEIDLEFLTDISEKISKNISEDPPISLLDGGLIKSGFSKEVDELRSLSGDSRTWLRNFEEQEKRETGISTLKVRFNKVFGYYIEVTKAQQNKVPERYIRKQTLVNSERYITEELKERESMILNAQERICSLEYEMFCSFRDSFVPNINKLQEISNIVARVDVLLAFAHIAKEKDYVEPMVYDLGEKDGILKIEKGRHPIVESISNGEFISNDTYLNIKDASMAILTGPNMSGKSTYIRQVAIIVLMAQIGSFVPASKAEISITDRIFTRVGASDDLARGRSTFMVEMDEAANILNNATKYSLIVLDEVGRGTSTYDGVSIAWSLAEYLVNDVKARTLFATHYHELLKLAERYPQSVKNYNVLVEEDIEKGLVIFLRKIVEGGTDRSYGIYVAKMAGLPAKVIKRANEILESFEQKSMFSNKNEIREAGITGLKDIPKNHIQNGYQYPLFTAKESEVEREIQKMDIDNLTPIEALNKIVEWRKKI